MFAGVNDRSVWFGACVLLAGLVAVGCGDGGSPSAPTSPSAQTPPPAAGDGQFTLRGDPESPAGATWTYGGIVEGVTVDLQGILLKPRGAGPFPAVVISHGAGGNANGYSRGIAGDMVQWGLVCIATNYTHAAGVAEGAPGTWTEPGASRANVVRARAAHEILRRVGYVDMNRVAAHGHSMGAFVTSALVAAYPGAFRAASHTAGGVLPGGIAAAAPTENDVRRVRTPYQLHHGDADEVVPLVMDEYLAAVLRSAGVLSELHVYPGAAHNDLSRSPTVLARVRAWYQAQGMF
jgi:dienelactone hydrolase